MTENLGESLVNNLGLIILFVALAFAVYYVVRYFTSVA